MKRALLLSALALVGPSLSAQGTDNVERIRALLVRPDILCGQFAQAKVLVGLQRPVKSSGRFCVVVDKGILWRTLRPFPTTLRLTRDDIVESRGEETTARLSARQEPAVRMINDLLFSLLAGDMQRLTGSFDITSAIDGKAWHARLAPREGGMQRVIGGIDLTGGEFVNHIVIREASGDRTEITFSAIATGKGAMQADEARQF